MQVSSGLIAIFILAVGCCNCPCSCSFCCAGVLSLLFAGMFLASAQISRSIQNGERRHSVSISAFVDALLSMRNETRT